MAGGVAEAFWGILSEIREQAVAFLDETMIEIVNAFESRFGRKNLPALERKP